MSPVFRRPAAIAARDDDRRRGGGLLSLRAAQPAAFPLARRHRRPRARLLLRRLPRRRRRPSTPPGSTRSTRGAPRPPIGRRRRPSVGRRVVALGRCGAAQGLVRDAAAGRAEISLLLEGIHCGACIWLLESWLGGSPAWSRRRSTSRRAARASCSIRSARGCRRSCAASRASAIARYPYDPARREALARRESRALLLRMAVALLAMMQVMMFAVPTYITVDGVEPRAPAAARVGEPHADAAGAAVLGGAVLPRRVARPQGPASGHGRSGRARPRRRVRCQRVGDVPRRGRRLLRLGDDVHRAAARRPLRRARRRGGAPATRSRRSRRRRPATAERLPDWPASRAVEIVGAAALAAATSCWCGRARPCPPTASSLDGRAEVEEAILTGESRPRARGPGDAVLAGSVARDGALIGARHAPPARRRGWPRSSAWSSVPPASARASRASPIASPPGSSPRCSCSPR